MSELRVAGGRRLSGEVNIHGAKNSALPILAAAVLVPGVSVIHNCPRLSDVSA
ncbi:MAG: UDP-N-acetylglucosamine 1-carboxyvinyltransferase, partial [Oscillospiraceae bacterium]|nr:UDP-N-acetylglucosamine 1-carboxyvinyltransferase [Oscillospiraceae bacterium]